VRTYLNLVIVFFLCGLWHGASWSFVTWGLYHGSFLVLERMGLGRLIARCPRALRHAYTLLVVMVGWVFFRADHLATAVSYLGAMVGLHGTRWAALAEYLPGDVVLATLVGVVGSAPIVPMLARLREGLGARPESRAARLYMGWELAAVGATALVFYASAALLAAGTYNPFIYFRF